MLPTLGHKAYDELRRMLVHGRLQPGMQLVNRKLADEIEMSMTPVREAVMRLASEGFVDHVPGAGAFVRRISRQELSQLYDVRKALEPLAAAEAAAHSTAAEIGELRAIAADSFRIIRAIAAEPCGHASPDLMTRWLDDEQRFHEVMFQAARNRWLTKIAADLKLLAFGFSPQRRMPEFLTVSAAVRTWRGHRRLIRALATRNADLAAATTALHIAQGRDEVMAHLDSHGDVRADSNGEDGPRPSRRRAAPRGGANAVSGKPGRRKAFTIIELLVVISLLVMLLGLVVPAVQLARERSRRSKCLDNLRTIGMALQAFENTNGELPIGNDSTNGLGWRVYLLPFLEQQELFAKFDLGPGPFGGGANQEGPNKSVWAATRLDGYLCPSATRHLATDGSSKLLDPLRDTYNAQYYGVAGPLGTSPGSGQAYSHVDSGVYGGWARSGLLFMDSRVRSGDVRDGLTNTLMVGELAVANVSAWTSGWHGGGDGGNWVRGAGVEVFPLTGTGATKNVKYGINITPLLTKDINNCSFSSLHEGRGANFVRGDGGTVFLSDDIALTTYKSLCSRNGREAGASMTD